MKKEKQSAKKNRNMATKSIPKSMQPLLSALEDFIVQIIEQVSEQDEESVRAARREFEVHQSELVKLLTANMSAQNTESVKRVKDPNAPKRGKSSYIFFCVDKRDEIKAANPDMSAKEIIKELGRVWREDVSDKDKAKYSKLSDKDKARYEEEMKDYTPPPNVPTFVETKKAKHKGPKRGLTAYIFFCKENRSLLKEENPELPTKEVTAELGKRWKNLSDKNRKPYVKLAEKDKLRYEKDKENWVDPDESDTPKKKKKTVKTSKKKPVTRRKSGYILFCQEERARLKEENEDWTGQQITKELGRLWKELSPEEQADYNDRASSPVSEKGERVSRKSASSESELEELDTDGETE